jgi:hypothetical protein
LGGWPGVGSLDIEISSASGPVWAELKWAKTADYLFNCLWDAAKLARAVRDGVASAGYLVAGAPVSEWAKGSAYSILFDFSAYPGDSIVTSNPKFENCWRGWRKENTGTYPEQLAAPIFTWPEGEVEMRPDEGGEPWSIRVARVTAPGDETVMAPTFGI